MDYSGYGYVSYIERMVFYTGILESYIQDGGSLDVFQKQYDCMVYFSGYTVQDSCLDYFVEDIVFKSEEGKVAFILQYNEIY